MSETILDEIGKRVDQIANLIQEGKVDLEKIKTHLNNALQHLMLASGEKTDAVTKHSFDELSQVLSQLSTEGPLING